MAPFRFRLEQVRLYRKQLEEQAMQTLARAVAHRDSLNARVVSLQDSIREQQARLSRPEKLDSAERWLVQGYENALKIELEQTRRELYEAENTVDQCRADLVQKAKDRGLLDSLKEKQVQRHQLQERQQEQRTNDETATLRYKPAAV